MTEDGHGGGEVAFDRWREQVPPGFLYAVKASRFLTHLKKLKGSLGPLQRFLARRPPGRNPRPGALPASASLAGQPANDVAGYALQNARMLKRLLVD